MDYYNVPAPEYYDSGFDDMVSDEAGDMVRVVAAKYGDLSWEHEHALHKTFEAIIRAQWARIAKKADEDAADWGRA